MKIEECIKVKKFVDEYHKATLNILYTNNWLTKILEHRASQGQITLQQYNVLRILRGQYPDSASNSLVKERMISSTPDTSRLVDRIVLKGLVSRQQNSEDKRAVDLKITEKGLHLLEELEHDMILTNLLSQNLTKEEALTLSNLLDKLRAVHP